MPGFIPDHVLDQIRQHNDVAEVIGSYFPLKRAGANFRALCPFHKEKTPSFNVNTQKQIWHCFGCGVGGDVFSFVMKYENLDFTAAVRRLAARAGIHLETDETAGGPTRDQKETLLKLHEQVAEFYHQRLMKDPAAQVARDYLKKRQITTEIAKRWRLGHSPDAWDGLIQWAKAKKYSEATLETAGLVLRRDSGEGYYDRFRGRLMFPICDEQGRPVGFSARILADAKDQPKYVNSPETPIFQKGRILFALDKAKRAIIDAKVAVICEGQVDTISCHEAGVTNVVAPQGTALTEQHARILKRHAEEVVLMFDADTAGQNAAVRSAEPLWDAGMAIRVATLPVGHDPDSFVKQFGSDALKQLLAAAPTFFLFLLDRLSRQYDPRTERGKVQIAHQVAEWLVRTPTPILLATYAQQTARRLDISEDVLRKEVSKLTGRSRSERHPADADEPPVEVADAEFERPPALPAEELLLQAVLAEEHLMDSVVERLDPAWLTESLAGTLLRTAVELYSRHQWTGPKALLSQTAHEATAKLVSDLLLRPHQAGSLESIAADCLVRLEQHSLETRLRALRKQQAEPGLDLSESMRLQQEALDLRRKLDNIGGFLRGR